MYEQVGSLLFVVSLFVIIFVSIINTTQQYERYFAANAVEKGGSFYLQSKIYRAKEQLDEFIQEKENEQRNSGK
jgi:import inner membrane translocase subunit TIM16